jgi:hypothetical protein
MNVRAPIDDLDNLDSDCKNADVVDVRSKRRLLRGYLDSLITEARANAERCESPQARESWARFVLKLEIAKRDIDEDSPRTTPSSVDAVAAK